MASTSTFRLSTYLTLGLACACVGYAEAALFPEVAAFAGLAVVALAVIYRVETRAELLSVPDANRLGGGIGLVCAAWAGYRVVREIRTTEFADMGWQWLLLPLVGPLLLATIPAKLLRKEKHARDWWSMHGIALAAVFLAAALTDDPVVYVLVAVYGACGVWALAEFARARATGVVPPTPVAHPEPSAVPVVVARSGTSRGIGRGLLWAAVAAAIALPLFLLTPRSSQSRLEIGKPRVETGYAANQMIDLTRTGDLQSNPEPVFEVIAEYIDGRPKTDLSPDQRWRGTTLTRYQNGAWSQERDRLLTAADRVRSVEPWSPPDLGPGAYQLTFTLVSDDRSYFLADPVAWVAGQPAPVASLCQDGGSRGWAAVTDGSGGFLRSTCLDSPAPPNRYVQYTRDGPEPDLGPAFHLAVQRGSESASRPRFALQSVLSNYPARVRGYADQLVARLVAEGKLPAGASRPGDRDEHHEAIARAFARHLAEDPEFTYTSQLRRARPDADPIEEFLLELKAGHCERFAAALVMMLRSQGIPAVLVLGFRGCENLGDGRYVVRQENAHAWVEALVSRPHGNAKAGDPAAEWHWLSLDPTPSRTADQEAGRTPTGAWGRAMTWARGVFTGYFLNYTPARRERAIRAVVGLLTDPYFLAGVAAAVGALVLIRVVRRRRPGPGIPPDPEPTRWFARLLGLLADHGFAAQPGETPREFAAGVSAVLARRTATAALATVPLDWAEAYYEVRFGGTPLAPDRRAELETRLDQLAAALRSSPG
jgi:transglutaminase-like putative cysteine protease